MGKRLDPLDPRGFVTGQTAHVTSENLGYLKGASMHSAAQMLNKGIRFSIVNRNTGRIEEIPVYRTRSGVFVNSKGNVLFQNSNDKKPSFPGMNVE